MLVFLCTWYEYRAQIKSAVIGSGVTSVGGDAFYNCVNLADVTIPSSVKSIGANAFYNCQALDTVSLPSALERIGDFAFFGCKRLGGVIIPKKVSEIGVGAFARCDSLMAIVVVGSNSNYSSDGRGILFDKNMTVIFRSMRLTERLEAIIISLPLTTISRT